MEYSNKIFCEAFSGLLKEKKIKLRSLAAKTNLNYSYFSKLSSRKTAPPIETIANISNALEINPEYFIEYRLFKLTGILKDEPEIINEVLALTYELIDKNKLKVAEEKTSYEKEKTSRTEAGKH
jgi:transcriptional regulator with XRE-family HTH domain